MKALNPLPLMEVGGCVLRAESLPMVPVPRADQAKPIKNVQNSRELRVRLSPRVETYQLVEAAFLEMKLDSLDMAPNVGAT